VAFWYMSFPQMKKFNFKVHRKNKVTSLNEGTDLAKRRRLSLIRASGILRRLSIAMATLYKDLITFFSELIRFLVKVSNRSFVRFETIKGIFVTVLYKQRGRYASRFIHSGMAGLAALGVMVAPVIAQEFPGRSANPWDIPSPSSVLSASTQDPDTTTQISDKVRDKTLNYTVQQGDTVSTVANKFGVSTDTILWQNNLSTTSSIKPGQILEVLPVTGVLHTVQKGDTVYSIAKKYDASPQAIVDFPYNTFVNDETFELAVGQVVIVPDGVKPSATQSSPRIRQITPDAGTVVASGVFVWPAGGTITQYYSWYHPGIDVANRAAPNILAADSGTVITSSWDPSGYGNKVIIDHGNGHQTLYAHMQRLYVVVGQSVARGNAIGKMGSTGRSTGTHLHFEILKNGVKINPLGVLR